MIKYEIDQKIQTKKNHVCGSNIWIIRRIGADLRLECDKCGREIVILRSELIKRLKK